MAPVDEDGTWGDDRGPSSILENGRPCALLSVDCDDGPPAPPLVSALALDVSESMGVHDPDLTLTHYAARRWIERLALGYDHCAIVTFDDRPTLLLPWNRSATTILATLYSTRPGGGGTFYTAALDDPPDGAIHVASGADGRRIVLLITDGGGTGDPQAIGRLARAMGVVVHVLSIARPAERTAREISRETAGTLFDDLRTTDEIDHAIDSLARTYRPDNRCHVRWMSASGCMRERLVEITLGRSRGTGTYMAPAGSTPSLQAIPSVVILPSSSTPVATAMLHAHGGPVRVSRVSVDHPEVMVEPSGELTIADGDSVPLRITLTRSDSLAFVARIVIESDACRPVLSAIRKEGKSKFSIPTVLRLDRPNGGETLLSGVTEMFYWSGSRGLPVDVDVSLDDGATWERIGEDAMQGSVAWPVPPAPSNTCRARVSIDTTSTARLIHPWNATSLFFSDDASLLVGRHRFRSLVDIRGVDDGRLIDRLQGSEIVGVEEGGGDVHLRVDPSTIETWSVERGMVVARMDLTPLDRHGLYSFTPDMRRCATTDWIGRDTTIITTWSLESSTPVDVHRLPGVLAAIISPDGTHLLAHPIFGDTVGRLIGGSVDLPLSLANAFGFRFQKRGDGKLWYGRSIDDGTGGDATIIMSIDARDGVVGTIGPIAGRGVALDLSDDGSVVALALERSDRHEVLVMNGDGSVIERRTVDRPVHGLALDAGGRRYALARDDSSVEVRWITGAGSRDASDSVWSIVTPSLRLTPRDTSGWVGHAGSIRIEALCERPSAEIRLSYSYSVVIDPPLLLPTKERWRMEGNRRVIEVTSMLDDTTRNRMIDVIPLLGESDRASITIRDAHWNGGERVSIDSADGRSGTFNILGICTDKGKRLIRDGDAPTVHLLHDRGEVVIEWQGFGDGRRTFRLYNILGELVDIIVASGRQGRAGTGDRGLGTGALFITAE